ncbi:MAG: hypothetical protein ACYTA5_23535, partial [Planctomycetota bacterium]
LISLLTEQRDLCIRFSALSERQRVTIVDHHPEGLLEVLADRQRLLDRFVELTGRLGPYQQQWRVMRSKLSADKSEAIDRLLLEVSTNLAEVLSSDRKDVELLSKRNNAAGGAGFRLRNNRQADVASRKEWMSE